MATKTAKKTAKPAPKTVAPVRKRAKRQVNTMHEAHEHVAMHDDQEQPHGEYEEEIERYRGATLATHIPQPQKQSLLYVNIREGREIVTHMVDIIALPQDIVESFIVPDELAAQYGH